VLSSAQVDAGSQTDRGSQADRGSQNVFLPDTGSPHAQRINRTTGTIVVQPLVRPEAMPPASTAADPTAAAPSPPVIRVSIGRVEVRAVMLPTPPMPRSRAARPSATLSLDEYLKSRQRGQR